MQNNQIYLDYQSTTMLDPRVKDIMLPYFSLPTNSHSRSHSYGWMAEEAVEEARKKVASLINADPKEIIFTSGATESNNLAIKGFIEFYKEKRHIVTSLTEHKSVLDVCRFLETQGIKVTYLRVKPNGLIDLNALEESITPETGLVSIMLANNEIGVIQPLKQIGEICRKHNVALHTDAAQGYGKVPIDVKEMNISLLSVSGHKIYGPMGVGVLYVRRKDPRIRLEPIIHGGGQERGLRSGTLPTPLIVGLGAASDIAAAEMVGENERLLSYRNLLLSTITAAIPDIIVNGDLENRLAGNLNISFPYVEGESIIMAIKDLAVSSGSACTSASLEPSYVIRSLDGENDAEHSSIRFGFGRYTTQEEVVRAGELIIKNINRLREMSPLWEMKQQGIDLKSIKWGAH